MTTTETEERAAYEPSGAQLARAAALRRFNVLAVYLPVSLGVVAALLIVGLLLYGALSPGILGTREFASALADIIVILTIVPLTLLCAVVPLAAVGLFIYQRRQPKRPHGRFQVLLWRLDTLLDKVIGRTTESLPMVARPVIEGHAIAAFVKSALGSIRRTFRGN